MKFIFWISLILILLGLINLMLGLLVQLATVMMITGVVLLLGYIALGPWEKIPEDE